MKRVGILFMVAPILLGVNSCVVTPGVAEPDIYICTILDDKILECQNSYDPNTRHDMTLINAIGYQCVSPKATGILETHHDIVHKQLNEALKK